MKQDFIETFSKETYKEVLERAGTHSREITPVKEKDRFIFSLLEIIDFQCCIYKDFAEGKISEAKLKKWMKAHKEEIGKYKGPPSSYMGLMSSAFKFLAS